MRIIHFSCVGPPQVGGIGRVASLEVASLVERGHDAHLVSLSTHAAFRFGNAGAIHGVEHFVADADIVHLHYPFFGTAGTLARLRRSGVIKKFVMTLHMDATATGPKGWAFDAYRKLFQPKILAAGDALLVSSKDYATHSSYAPVASNAIELPFGVDEIRFSPGLPERERFGLPVDVPVILFVGGMDTPHAFKGVDVLLRAAVRMPEAHLLLVGDGVLRKGYEKLAARIGITSRCHFAGSVQDDGLVAAYRSADVFAFPSISSAEAFGLVAVEAHACGLPVVATDLPGVRTVVADGETGFLVPVGNPQRLAERLNEILKDTGMRQRMGEAARQRVLDRFTWTKHMEGLERIYSNVCASPS
ncbi:glycosyltransferase family 4 protein [Patescibacteria group bacterium]|nr:glycosyltransferase family 4 protein [Patescibacteria group bacterium]